MSNVPVEEQLEHALEMVDEYGETIEEQEGKLTQLQENLEATQFHVSELEEQLQVAKVALNTINTALGEVTFPW